MLRIHPFQALRPSAAKAREFSCERLDHLSEAAWREVAARAPRSVAALASGLGDTDLVEACRASKALIEESAPTMYMHRQVKGGRRVAGLIALLDASTLREGVVRPMRLACPARSEAWRAAQNRTSLQMDSVIVGFHADETTLDLFEREMNDRPLFHVVADDGATHTFWSGRRADDLAAAFANVGRGYLLEGHARAHGPSPDGRLLAVLTPLDAIAAHWAVRRITGEAAAGVRSWLLEHGREVAEPGEPPAGWADACVASGAERRWFRFQLPAPRRGGSSIQATDHGRLDACLEAATGPQVADRGERVPGDSRPAAVERLAEGGVAVVLSRPSVADLTALADQGELLPHGSTWFEPRIRSGLWMRRTTMPE